MPDTITSDLDIHSETLSGDLRDRVLERIRGLAKPWAQMTGDEQARLNDDVDMVCRRIVGQAVRTIAADGRQQIVATVDTVTFKDEIKAVLKIAKTDEQRHELADATGQTVLLIVADAERYLGEQGRPPVDGADPELPLDDAGPVFDQTPHGQEG